MNSFGWAVGQRTEEDAKAIAVKGCEAMAGQSCTSDFTFVNSCAVVAFGPRKYSISADDPSTTSMRSLRKKTLRDCGEEGCKVVREGCSVAGR